MTDADIIREYYRRIDACDVEWVTRLFADDAVYNRADTTYRGRVEIARFFRTERKIRGDHGIDDLFIDAPARSIIVTGNFRGSGKAGDARQVAFADVWRFNEENLVVRRRTFLALGSDYVRE